jgi:hypothetical protein
MPNCTNCGTELVLSPPEQIFCDWCVKVIGPRVSARSRDFKYRVFGPEGTSETSTKEEAIKIARQVAQSGSKVWVRNIRTGQTIWP